MYKGPVTWTAEIIHRGISFDSVECIPPNLPPIVDRISITAVGAANVECTSHFTAVDSHEEAIEFARRITIDVLDRLTFKTATAIREPEKVRHNLEEINPPPGFRMTALAGGITMTIGGGGELTVGLLQPDVKAEIERPRIAGEHLMGLYRAALLSPGHVEKYMHLYNLLLMIRGDSQPKVERFILDETGLPQESVTRSNGQTAQETRYTRIRNEFAHVRPHVNMSDTKAEMELHWTGLRDLVKRAIELV